MARPKKYTPVKVGQCLIFESVFHCRAYFSRELKKNKKKLERFEKMRYSFFTNTKSMSSKSTSKRKKQVDSNGRKTTSITFNQPTYDALKARADDEHRSVTGQVVAFVEVGLGIKKEGNV